jgi:putative intracellular protease/amidase
MKILMVMTSHSKLGNTGHKTGVWLEEFAAPYFVFRDAGLDITLASPRGGHPPIDPQSERPEAQTAATRRLYDDKEARAWLATTAKLRDVAKQEFDAVFYPGGHGPLWDLAEDPVSIELIETMYRVGRPVAAVCHGPAALRHARGIGDFSLVKDKTVTGFTNTEEAAAGLADVVPFRVEDMLRENGGRFTRAPNWFPHSETDGNLITGQNPASAEPTAKAVLLALAAQPFAPPPAAAEPVQPSTRPG